MTLVTSFALLASVVYFGPVSLRNIGPLQNAILYDSSGNVLAELRPEQNREVVSLAKIPPLVQHAFIAAEDERFWSHIGIDPQAIARAIFADARGNHQGASTITQQYVRNTEQLHVGTQRSIARKIREAIAAIRIDRKYSKKQILEGYLNTIYLGNGAYGVQAAAKLYFGYGVSDLTLSQAAMIAGITANPAAFDPRLHKSRALARRDYVLRRMQTLHYITAGEASDARQQEVLIAQPVHPNVPAPGFVDWVKGLLVQQFGEDGLYRGGLRVTTTLDRDIQQTVETAVAATLNRKGDPDAAMIVMNAATGSVIAMYGGRNNKLGDLNLATQGRRQAGSAFKPFVLAAALEQGKTLNDTYRGPGSIRLKLSDNQVWPVKNFDGHGYGRLTLKRALANSVNTVFAQLIRDIGPDSVVEVAHAAGVASRLQPVHSLALGTSDVSPLDLVTGYSTFAREGDFLSTTGMSVVTDGGGKTIFRNDGNRTGRRVMPASVADDVIEGLTEVVARGTGRPARVNVDSPSSCPEATDPSLVCGGTRYVSWGKTGTTEDHADAWFVGGVGGYVAAVWVGHPEGHIAMNNVHGIKVVGSSFPGQIWKTVMTAVMEKYKPADDAFLSRPKGSPKQRTASNAPSSEPSLEPEPVPTEQPPTDRPGVKLLCPPFCG